MELVCRRCWREPVTKVSQSVTIPMGALEFPMLGSNNFVSLAPEYPGLLTMLWDEAIQPQEGRTFDDDTVLFALHFKLVGAPGANTSLQIGSIPTLSRWPLLMRVQG